MKKIKYVIEQTILIPTNYTNEDIDECIKLIAEDNNHVWCEEHEDLLITIKKLF